jgi:hypothetical protein
MPETRLDPQFGARPRLVERAGVIQGEESIGIPWTMSRSIPCSRTRAAASVGGIGGGSGQGSGSTRVPSAVRMYARPAGVEMPRWSQRIGVVPR